MSVSWFDGVSFTVECAFGYGALDASPVWTDISAYVESVPNVQHGRQSESSDYAPSTMTVVLKNSDRRFDPEYASGPFFGDLLPMVPIRFRVTYSATTYDVFRGFVTGWPQTYESVRVSTVTVAAVDGTRLLAQASLARSAYGGAVRSNRPVRYWPMQEETGPLLDEVTGTVLNPSGEWVSLATGPVTGASRAQLPGANPSKFAYWSSTQALGVEPRSIDGWVYVASKVSEWDAFVGPSINVVGANGSRAYIYLDDLTDNRWIIDIRSQALNKGTPFAVNTTIPASPGWHHVALALDSSEYRFWVDGELVYSASASTGFSSASGETVKLWSRSQAVPTVPGDSWAHVAVYDTALVQADIDRRITAARCAFGHPTGERAGARIGRVLDEIGWPAGQRDLSTGDTHLAAYTPDGGAALAYLRTVEAADDGMLFLAPDGKVTYRDRQWQWSQSTFATFSDDGTDLDYDDVTVDPNTLDPLKTIVEVNFTGGRIERRDKTAVDAYGPQTDTITAAISSPFVAEQLAAYRLRLSKDPQTRITRLVFSPRDVPASMFPVAFGIRIGQRIAVEVRPQSIGSAIVKTVVVQGYRHSMTATEWTTELYLSPAAPTRTEAPYLIVGDATYGKTGTVAGNKIPY